MFDLGEADKIDELINKMRQAVTGLNLKSMGVSVCNSRCWCKIINYECVVCTY